MATHDMDFLVIGAGMAGASAAALLARDAKVAVLEMESAPGYHSTGRSAAFFAPAYGNAVIRTVTGASENFFHSPPTHTTDVPFLRPRDCLFVARQNQLDQLSTLKEDMPSLVEIVSTDFIVERVPILREDYCAGGLLVTDGGDLDVHAIHQAYLKLLRQQNGEVIVNARVEALERKNALWVATTPAGTFEAPVVINAAGAWADHIAQLAGLEALGIVPKRRTAILIDPPEGHQIEDWPFVVDVDEQFYFKPDAGLLLISPSDQTPSHACDAQPEVEDVAMAAARFEAATGLEVKRINHSWAGLRVFAPDDTPVVGFDPRQQGFFWLAGQGGYGIQTAPGMAEIVSHLLAGNEVSRGFAEVLNVIERMKPERLVEKH